jgi:hypothetical protein
LSFIQYFTNILMEQNNQLPNGSNNDTFIDNGAVILNDEDEEMQESQVYSEDETFQALSLYFDYDFERLF